MKKQVLAVLMVLCFSAAGGTAGGAFEADDKHLLVLHLGYAHPLSGALLARSPCPSATQAPLQ